jgi:hypothetical protein
MKVFIELLPDRFYYFRMSVPDVADSNSGNEVHIAFAIGSIQVNSFGPFNGDEKRMRCGRCEMG